MSNQEDASENRANLSAKVCDYCLKQFLSTDPASEKEAMKNHLRVCHSQPQVLINRQGSKGIRQWPMN